MNKKVIWIDGGIGRVICALPLSAQVLAGPVKFIKGFK